jgi:hypothetical protein
MKVSARSVVSQTLMLLCFWASVAVARAQVTVVLAGTSSGAISQALSSIGQTFTAAGSTMGPNPSTYGLRAGDFIIISNDGGTDSSFFDYTPFLNSGGHVILVGGSNYQPYRDWVSGYFNITDTANAWHTDINKAWTSSAVGNAVTSGVPNTYTFDNISASYHMLGFLATTNTLLYGTNSENVSIAAYRNYNNGGSLNYMALDIGNASYVTTRDLNGFVVPWLRSALAIPEPSTYALIGAGLAVLGLRGWRRRPGR